MNEQILKAVVNSYAAEGVAAALARPNGFLNDRGEAECSSCHTLRQETMEDGTVVGCFCSCEYIAEQNAELNREYRRSMAAYKEDMRNTRIDALRERCLEKKYRGMRFEDAYDGSHVEVCKKWAAEFDKMRELNIGIILYGGVETGKTFLAACIANALIDREIPATIITMSGILSALGKNYGDNKAEVLRELCAYPLLVIDDYGAEFGNAYNSALAFEFINAREACDLPTVITTNLEIESFDNTTDKSRARILSRIGMMCPVRLHVTGGGKRAKISMEKLNTARSLLQ